MGTNPGDISRESHNPPSIFESRQLLKTCFTAEEWTQISSNDKMKLRVFYHPYVDSPSLRERYTLKEFLLLKPTVEKRFPHITGSPVSITTVPDPESSLIDPVIPSETAVVLAKSIDQISESSDSSLDLESPPSKRKTLEELWDASDEEHAKEKAALLIAKTPTKKAIPKKKAIRKKNNKKPLKKPIKKVRTQKIKPPTKKTRSASKKPGTKQTGDKGAKRAPYKSDRRRFKPPPPPPCFYEKKSSGKKNTPWESKDSSIDDVKRRNIDLTYSSTRTSLRCRSRRGEFPRSSITYGSKFENNDLSSEPSTSSGIYTRRLRPLMNAPTSLLSRSVGSSTNLPDSGHHDYTTDMRSFEERVGRPRGSPQHDTKLDDNKLMPLTLPTLGLGFYLPRDDITATEDLTLNSAGTKESDGKIQVKENDTTFLVPVTTNSSSQLSKLSKVVSKDFKHVTAKSVIGAKVPPIAASSRSESSSTSSEVTRSTQTVIYEICRPSVSTAEVETPQTKTLTSTPHKVRAGQNSHKIIQHVSKLQSILPNSDSAIKTVSKTEGRVIKPLEDITGTWQSQQNVAASRSLIKTSSNVSEKSSVEPFKKPCSVYTREELWAPKGKTSSAATLGAFRRDPKFENKFITINYKLSKDPKNLIPVTGKSPLKKIKLPTYTQTYTVTTEASTFRPIITSLQKSGPESVPVVGINLPQDQIYIFQKAQAETIQSLVRPVMAASTSQAASTSKQLQAKTSSAKRSRKTKASDTAKKLEELDENIMEVITVKYPTNVAQAQIEALSTAATIDPLTVIPPERTHIPIPTASDLTDPKKQPKIIHKPRIIRHSASKPMKPVSRMGTVAIRPTSPQCITLDKKSTTFLKLPPLTPIRRSASVQTTTSAHSVPVCQTSHLTQSETIETKSGDVPVVLEGSEMIQTSSLEEDKSKENVKVKPSARDSKDSESSTIVFTEIQETLNPTQDNSTSEDLSRCEISQTKTEESKKLYVISSGVYEGVTPSTISSSRTDKEVSSVEEMLNFKEITRDLKTEIFATELGKTTDEESASELANGSAPTTTDSRDVKNEGSTKVLEQGFDDIGSATSMTVPEETVQIQAVASQNNATKAISRSYTDEEILAVEVMTKDLKTDVRHTLSEKYVDEERIFDQFMLKTIQSGAFSFPSDEPMDLTMKSSRDLGQRNSDTSFGTSASNSKVPATAKKPKEGEFSKTISRFYTDEEILAAQVMTNDLKTEILLEKEPIPGQVLAGTNEPTLTSSSVISISSDDPMESNVEDVVKTERLQSKKQKLIPEQILMETNGAIPKCSSVISISSDEAVEENINLAEEGSHDVGFFIEKTSTILAPETLASLQTTANRSGSRLTRTNSGEASRPLRASEIYSSFDTLYPLSSKTKFSQKQSFSFDSYWKKSSSQKNIFDEAASSKSVLETCYTPRYNTRKKTDSDDKWSYKEFRFPSPPLAQKMSDSAISTSSDFQTNRYKSINAKDRTDYLSLSLSPPGSRSESVFLRDCPSLNNNAAYPQ